MGNESEDVSLDDPIPKDVGFECSELRVFDFECVPPEKGGYEPDAEMSITLDFHAVSNFSEGRMALFIMVTLATDDADHEGAMRAKEDPEKTYIAAIRVGMKCRDVRLHEEEDGSLSIEAPLLARIMQYLIDATRGIMADRLSENGIKDSVLPHVAAEAFIGEDDRVRPRKKGSEEESTREES